MPPWHFFDSVGASAFFCSDNDQIKPIKPLVSSEDNSVNVLPSFHLIAVVVFQSSPVHHVTDLFQGAVPRLRTKDGRVAQNV